MEEAMRWTRPVVAYKKSLAAVGLFVFLAHPETRTALEMSLIGHMLVQLPLLAVCGWLAGSSLAQRRLAVGGVPVLLVAVFATLFWMIPRWLDASLSEATWEVAKFVTIPAFVGFPLGVCWRHLSVVTKGFVWANGISMLAVLGWLYLAAPVRVCNNYLINQQEAFGLSALCVAVAIAAYWVMVGLFGDWSQQTSREKRW